MCQYFDTCKAMEDEKVPYVASMLKDDAAVWWRNHIDQADNNEVLRITNWKSFKTALLKQFKPVNASQVAKDCLAVLRQEKSVQKYITVFCGLVLQITDINKAEQKDR